MTRLYLHFYMFSFYWYVLLTIIQAKVGMAIERPDIDMLYNLLVSNHLPRT